jgi:hypothetical protein
MGSAEIHLGAPSVVKHWQHRQTELALDRVWDAGGNCAESNCGVASRDNLFRENGSSAFSQKRSELISETASAVDSGWMGLGGLYFGRKDEDIGRMKREGVLAG